MEQQRCLISCEGGREFEEENPHKTNLFESNIIFIVLKSSNQGAKVCSEIQKEETFLKLPQLHKNMFISMK